MDLRAAKSLILLVLVCGLPASLSAAPESSAPRLILKYTPADESAESNET